MYFDGIRHAAEIAGLAYSRLRQTLTEIATADLSEHETSTYQTAAFLDAWALVDAIDRFRTLWKQMHSNCEKLVIPGEPTLEEALLPIRQLRNVADHVASRIDQVIAKRAAAMGVISWFTATSVNPVKGFLCAIIPGTIRNHKTEISSPSGRTFEWPTGAIWLEAGGHKACLCDALPHIALRIRDIEEGVAAYNAELPPDEEYAQADVLFKAHMTFVEGKMSHIPVNTKTGYPFSSAK